MRIGIDLDDTICRTSEMVHIILEGYAERLGFNPLDIMNDETMKADFFQDSIEDIYSRVEVKRNVFDVLRRLKSKGNEIYILTARSNTYLSQGIDVEKITKEWLLQNEIGYDDIVFGVYGDSKAAACKKLRIDLMIEDDPFNYKKITGIGIKCLLFDDREKYDLENDYMTNWPQIEKHIERNR